MKKVFKILFSRMFMTILILVAQLALFFYAIWELSNYFIYFYIALTLLSIFVIFKLMSKSLNPSYKLVWFLVILLFPGFGGLIYVMYGTRRMSKKDEEKMLLATNLTQPHIYDDNYLLEEIKKMDKSVFNQASYLSRYSTYPLQTNT
ncbi:MAG TPA: cardiolipin synthase, partial [Firmicutes bacterium]|nr:cardiolipin synthase [Bacillota bacterium]